VFGAHQCLCNGGGKFWKQKGKLSRHRNNRILLKNRIKMEMLNRKTDRLERGFSRFRSTLLSAKEGLLGFN
jgi:hypothetical protein